MRLRLVVALALATMGLSACSSSYDGWFANPCPHPVEIRTLWPERDSDPVRASDDAMAQATLPAEKVTKVEDAYFDANGFTWFVEVEGAPLITVTDRQLKKVKRIVVIPASACERH